MAFESDSAVVQNIIQRKMVRKPQLTPKTVKGQQTLGQTPQNTIQYQRLKSEYYLNPSGIQPFLNYIKGKITHNQDILALSSGIYTWILKRGHLYVAPLITNQEIGSLHTNINTITITTDNLGVINRNTHKNVVNEETKEVLRVTPQVAGELLLTREENGVETEDGPLRIYFNIQSGTFSEKIIKSRVERLAKERKLSPKDVQLKEEVRDAMVKEAHEAMAKLVNIPLENVRFLGCDETVQNELEKVPLLNQGAYEFGPCRDDDKYLESEGGRNLIRRFTIQTTPENRAKINTYFTNEAYVWTPPPKAVDAYSDPSSRPSKSGKVKKERGPRPTPYNNKRTNRKKGGRGRFYKKNKTRKMKQK